MRISEYKPSLSTTQAGDELGKSGKTIARWIEHYGLSARKVAGKYRIDPPLMAVLKTVSEMTGARSEDTIRRVISSSGWAEDESGQAQDKPSQAGLTLDHIRQAVAESSDLAERYAKAAYKIGELENEVKHSQALIESLRSDKEALEAQLRALPSPGEHQAVKAKLEALETKPARSPWTRLLDWFSK